MDGAKLKKALLILSLGVLFSSCSKPIVNGIAKIEVASGSCWEGDFDGDRRGCGSAEIEMFEQSGRYSAVVYKIDDDGSLLKLSLVINGKLVDAATTNRSGSIFAIAVSGRSK